MTWTNCAGVFEGHDDQNARRYVVRLGSAQSTHYLCDGCRASLERIANRIEVPVEAFPDRRSHLLPWNIERRSGVSA